MNATKFQQWDTKQWNLVSNIYIRWGKKTRHWIEVTFIPKCRETKIWNKILKPNSAQMDQWRFFPVASSQACNMWFTISATPWPCFTCTGYGSLAYNSWTWKFQEQTYKKTNHEELPFWYSLKLNIPNMMDWGVGTGSRCLICDKKWANTACITFHVEQILC